MHLKEQFENVTQQNELLNIMVQQNQNFLKTQNENGLTNGKDMNIGGGESMQSSLASSIDFAENIQYKKKYFGMKEELDKLKEECKSQKVTISPEFDGFLRIFEVV